MENEDIIESPVFQPLKMLQKSGDTVIVTAGESDYALEDLPEGLLSSGDMQRLQVMLGFSQNQQPIAPTVPQSLSRAQARAALILAGLIDQVQPAIDTIAAPLQRALVQNDWDNRSTFDRDNPTLLSLSSALGLTDAQLDGLFIEGAKL